MEILVKENRDIIIPNETIAGTQNENKATTLNFKFPDNFENYEKVIYLYKDKNTIIGKDIIENNSYILNNAITQYKTVNFYIKLIKDDTEWITATRTLLFNDNLPINQDVPKPIISEFDKLIAIQNEEIIKVKELQKEVQDFINELQAKLDKGDFNGKDALINGENVITLKAGTNININQENDILTINNTYQYDDTEITENINEIQRELTGLDIEVDNLTNNINLMANDINTHTNELNELENKYNTLHSELLEQEQSINHLDDTKADKNTTYTKHQVDELIGSIENVRIEVVEDLPEQGETNVIYFVRKQDQEFDDVFYEYVWENEQYELIGNTQIDLSDYVTNEILTNALNNYYTKENIDSKGYATTVDVINAKNTCEPKMPNSYDYCVQSVLYGNGESGYRKYKNGMLEQWGVATTRAEETEFTMHQPQIDQNFSIFIEPREQGNFFHYAIPSANQKFKGRIQTRDSVSMAVRFQWRSWGRWK